jgi:hypothetical protein
MKLTNLSLLALSATLASARFVEKHEQDQVVLNANAVSDDRYLIELAPGKTQWVTEEEKWELRRVGLLRSVLLRGSLLTSQRMDRISWTSPSRAISDLSKPRRRK